MSVRALLAALTAAAAAALAFGAPLVAAGSTPVDDYWRDQAAAAAPATIVDDYFRDATVAPATVVDDYFRDVQAPSAAPATAVDDYFRDAPVVVTTSGNGFNWADFGIGAAVSCGALLLLAGLGLGIRASRLSGTEATKSTEMPA